MSPVSFGGGMVFEVSDESSTYRSDVKVFEAGTASIADVIAFGAAIDYVTSIGLSDIHDHVKEILVYAKNELESNFSDKIKIYAADTESNAGIISFDVIGIHPHDVAEVLGRDSVCVRAGHHCAQPLMRHYEVTALSRISFYIYNDKADVDIFINSLKKVFEVFKK
jgi:cysteine desulfurase/selenocysteine lyase